MRVMRRNQWMRKIVPVIGAGVLLGGMMSVQAAVPEDLWEYTLSYDEEDNAVYDFEEVEVTLPVEWDGKCDLEIGEKWVNFYHVASRDAIEEKHGEAIGGILFSLCYSEDYDFMNTAPDYEIIGSGSQGVYYVTYPTDVQGFTEDEDIWEEWTELVEDARTVARQIVVTEPGEGIVNTGNISQGAGSTATGEYIVADSSTRLLTKADLSGMNADELQMAINEIYARHGRKFVTKSIQDYFNSKSWYKGTVEAAKFDPSSLNQYENENIALMLSCMKQAGSGSSTGVSGSTGSTTGSGSTMYATTTVNVRSTASTSGSIMGVVPQDSSVTVTGSATNGWVPVNYNGIRGYISQQYLRAGTGSASSQGSSSSAQSSGSSVSGEDYDALAAAGGSITGTVTARTTGAVTIQTDNGLTYSFTTCEYTTYFDGDAGEYVSISYLGSLDDSPMIQSMTRQSTPAELTEGLQSIEGTVTFEGNDIIEIQADDGQTYSFYLGTLATPEVGDYVVIQYRGALDAPQVVSVN